jgi:hypothetical protein
MHHPVKNPRYVRNSPFAVMNTRNPASSITAKVFDITLRSASNTDFASKARIHHPHKVADEKDNCDCQPATHLFISRFSSAQFDMIKHDTPIHGNRKDKSKKKRPMECIHISRERLTRPIFEAFPNAHFSFLESGEMTLEASSPLRIYHSLNLNREV